ncbi:hypothetical protein M9Y10_020761 [Tritrichomonas musculus]|uniref:Uncharacterized protein n=1 Tax=Tritrichomonas musculus TaxID=1915356 RepID=A0ABR2HFH6_9EUKA
MLNSTKYPCDRRNALDLPYKPGIDYLYRPFYQPNMDYVYKPTDHPGLDYLYKPKDPEHFGFLYEPIPDYLVPDRPPYRPFRESDFQKYSVHSHSHHHSHSHCKSCTKQPNCTADLTADKPI